MQRETINELEARRPAIKREWEHLLRTEPTLSALANPDTLVLLMDRTLDQLLRGVQTRLRQTTPLEVEPPYTSLQRRCACGRNPLSTYFATGELALRAATAETLLENFALVQTVLHVIASREIDALCGACLQNDSAGGSGMVETSEIS